MGQKVNPIGLRLGINRTWDSRWYADENYSDLLHEDLKIRSMLKNRLSQAGVSRIVIERPAKKARITIHSARPGVERRVSSRRAMKRAVQSAMRLGALGIRINCSGRLGGAEIARMVWYREGRVPLHTLRANVDYGTATGETTYGSCGVKIWIFKGDIMAHDPMAMDKLAQEQQPQR
jgi:small subunit ribosomal protein S3